jgi:hypothetical protein
MKTNSIAALVSASAIALFVSSCDSKQEQAREEQLENKAESIDATADQLRKDGERVADMKEESADATRDNVEKRADQLEEAADDVREKK